MDYMVGRGNRDDKFDEVVALSKAGVKYYDLSSLLKFIQFRGNAPD